MDQGYEFLVTTFLQLNHDRYKTYFTQFLALHFGIFAGMANFKWLIVYFCIAGILLGGIGFLVQNRIREDIRATWLAIRDHEATFPQGQIRLFRENRGGFPATAIMLFVPVIFSILYIIIILQHCAEHYY